MVVRALPCPLQKAQRLLGHSDPKLTAVIYTHLETEDLRDAVESLPSVVATTPGLREQGSKLPLEQQGDGKARRAPPQLLDVQE